MVWITVEGLRTEGSEELGSATLDVPAETELASLPPLFPGYLRPQGFTRLKQNGTKGCSFELDISYRLKYPAEDVAISTDCPSNFTERCINIDDSFVHFANLEKASQELTAKLKGDGLVQSSSIMIDDQLEITFHRTLRMPDDDKIHPLPASRGVFPLYNVDAFAARLPERITQHGGIFFPMWQREAIWINFKNSGKTVRYAIRVNIGHINAISGLDIFEAASTQDYVVVPGQKWLDGIAVGPGVVRQFVAMPLGSGYTVEGQVTGKETFGGIQIEIIPSYACNAHKFKCPDDRNNYFSAAENRTPRWYSLKDGDVVKMTPVPSTFNGLARLCDCLDDGESFEGIKSLRLMADYYDPFLDFPETSPGSFRTTGKAPAGLKRRAISLRARKVKRRAKESEFQINSSSSRDNDPGLARSSRRIAIEREGQFELGIVHDPKDLQEMGIAAGGKLAQDIVQDKSSHYIWNKARAKLLGIHILHPQDFEAVTHFLPPKTPITTEEYLTAGIPFYAIEEDPDQRLDGSEVLAGVKSVSAMDSHVGVHDGSSTDFEPSKPKRCAKCAVRLCDCIVRPCSHQFCHMCIKTIASPGTNTSSSDEQRRCPLCSEGISHVAGFSAPMNLPGEETFKVNVPVVMLEVEDGRTEFRSVMDMRL